MPTPTDGDFLRLVEACRVLPLPKGNYLVDDYIENMLLTVLDYQMQGATVEKAINFYREHAASEITDFTSLKKLLAKYPDTQTGNQQIAQILWGYNYWNRVALLRRLLSYFGVRGVTNQKKLKEWATTADFEQDFKGQVKGADFAIFQWLIMRQGVETVKPDLWVHRFLEDVLGYSVTNEMAVDLIERAAREISVKAYELDWRIWEHQSGRT